MYSSKAQPESSSSELAAFVAGMDAPDEICCFIIEEFMLWFKVDEVAPSGSINDELVLFSEDEDEIISFEFDDVSCWN